MSISSRHSGITLIELIVTLAVLAVLAAIAVPSFNSFFTSSRAQAETSAFVEALAYARSEAVRRGQNVTVAAISGSNWHQGWNINVGGTTIRTYPAFAGTATLIEASAATTVVFNGQGQTVPAGVSTFNYCFATGNDNLERVIVVNNIGYVRVNRQVCP